MAGKQKRTAEASGEEMQRSEETLEFLVGGDVADRPDVAVHVEVWDNTFVADDDVSPRPDSTPTRTLALTMWRTSPTSRCTWRSGTTPSSRMMT